MSRILLIAILLAVGLEFPGEEAGHWIHLNNSNEIRALYRHGDSLWIGTNGGLHILDLLSGEFVSKHLIGSNLPSSSVRAIAGWGDSVLVATDGGLSIFTGDGVDFYTPESNPAFRHLRSIDFGPSGTICFGTYGHGAGMIRGGTLNVVTRLDSLLDDRVFAVLQMDDNTYYYATSLGLCSFKDSLWVSYRVGAGLPKGEVRDLLLTEDYAILALVSGEGVFYFDGSRGRRVSPRGLFIENDIAAIALDAEQTLWAVGRHGGIHRYRYGQWLAVESSDETIRKASWLSVHASREGGVYFGSRDGLIVSIEDGVTRKLKVPSDIPSNDIQAMMEDSTGCRYFAAGSFLLSLPRGERKFALEGLAGPIIAMVVTPDGELLCSTRWGLHRRANGRFVEVPIELPGKIPVICSMAFDPSGNLWAGTDQGEVLKFDGFIWLRMGESGELTGGVVDRIIIDGYGSLWVLSGQTGISRFEGDRWQNFPLSHFDQRPLIEADVDCEGKVVVAGLSGVWRYEREGTWVPIDLPPVKSSLVLTKIRFDRMGRMYVGTSGGMLLIGERITRHILPHNGIAGEYVSSVMIDSEGLLWVGFQKDGLSFIPVELLW